MQRIHNETDGARPVDSMPRRIALEAMLASHIAALDAVRGALSEVEAAASLVANAIAGGATIHYAAAGSSGLMALADACELPGTFQVPHEQIRVHMAGGVPVDGNMPGHTEDATREISHAQGSMRPGDVAIILSASGTTPYALAFADAARAEGVGVISIAGDKGCALLRKGDVGIALQTAKEIVEGSTRLGAGTAQKAVLNMISTLAGILLGHVHEGMMVNLFPDNTKLRRRATDIVGRIAGVSEAAAEDALAATGFDVKPAVLVASGVGADEARALLDRNDGHLRASLWALARTDND